MNQVKEYWEKATPMVFGVEKWDYEKKRSFRYTLQDYMGQAFRFESWAGKRVLEVGCGSGIDACEFARYGAHVSAVDITENAVKLTTELAKEAGYDMDVRQYNGLTIPFERETFDLVYAFGVLHHVKGVEELLDNIYKVTKDGGMINAMLYNTDSLLFAYSILHQRIFNSSSNDRLLTEANILAKTSKYSERNEGCPYTRTYTVAEARELFEQWYSNVTVEARYNVIDIGAERKVKLNLDDKYGLGWHLIVKGTK